MAALAEQLREAGRNFRKYFNIPFSKFEDRMLSVIFGQPMIDIALFDDYLQTPDDLSMYEQLVNDYGQEAADWFDKTFINI